MEEAIRNFPKQFEYAPAIENRGRWGRAKRYLLVGMGGSHLCGDILQAIEPSIDLTVCADYGLPLWSKERFEDALIIASSYSGNTEETLSAFEEATRRNLRVAVISTGGKLLELAQTYGAPYIQIPDTHIQPRCALGFMFKALGKMIGREDLVEEVSLLTSSISEKTERFERQGKELAAAMKNKIPLVYSSARNRAIASIWKIKLNETGKIPAFSNTFPELNHNEMTGFDGREGARDFAEKFHCIVLRDDQDHPRILKRMDLSKQLYKDRGLFVEMIEMEGSSRMERVFSSLFLADWTAYYTALQYHSDPEGVPMVEELKKLLG